jgi:hypothetical protein
MLFFCFNLTDGKLTCIAPEWFDGVSEYSKYFRNAYVDTQEAYR